MRLEFLALGLMENYWGLLNMQQHKFAGIYEMDCFDIVFDVAELGGG